MFKNL